MIPDDPIETPHATMREAFASRIVVCAHSAVVSRHRIAEVHPECDQLFGRQRPVADDDAAGVADGIAQRHCPEVLDGQHECGAAVRQVGEQCDGSRLGNRGRVRIDGCAELGAGHGTLGAGDAEPDERTDRGAQVGPLVVVEVGHAQHGERRRRRGMTKTASMIRICPMSLSRASSSAMRPSNRSLSGKPITNAWMGPMVMSMSSWSRRAADACTSPQCVIVAPVRITQIARPGYKDWLTLRSRPAVHVVVRVDDLLLNDKVGLRHCASKGIGWPYEALAEEGTHVIAGARTTASLDAIEGSPGRDRSCEPGAPSQLYSGADEHGRIDVLVNNMGDPASPPAFSKSPTTTSNGRCSSTSSPAARQVRPQSADVAQGRGSIVNVASVNAFYQPHAIDYPHPRKRPSSTSEVTLAGVRAKGIRINAVSPGPVSTDLWLGEDGVAQTVGRSLGIDADTARQQIVAGMGGIPSGRFTTPEEVATLVVLLASERTANVTGANFVIDGGLIKTT